jgi:hypothetical protein
MVVTDVNQLWVADITYIRLQDEFVFLAVILDACSRRVIGWALERTLEDDLTLAAWRMALSQRAIQPGLVHHSDRGSQYASTDYTDLLKAQGIDISMSRKGNRDNAACESFMKSLKYEEVLRNEYRGLGEARRSIVRFLEQVYNEKRLHSALGYRPPVEFEQALLARKQAAQTMRAENSQQRAAINRRRDSSESGVQGAPNREILQTTGFYGGPDCNRPKRVCADVIQTKTKPWGGTVPPPVGRPRAQVKERVGRTTLSSSSAISSGRPIP